MSLSAMVIVSVSPALIHGDETLSWASSQVAVAKFKSEHALFELNLAALERASEVLASVQGEGAISAVRQPAEKLVGQWATATNIFFLFFLTLEPMEQCLKIHQHLSNGTKLIYPPFFFLFVEKTSLKIF